MNYSYPKGVRPRVVAPQAPRKAAKRSKYNAQKTVVDNIVFDSKAEAKRYGELKMLEQTGKIHGLFLQPKFFLDAKRGGVIGTYRADFSYCVCAGGAEECQYNRLVVEDVKGMRSLPLAKWKQKHLKAEYGITVQEIR